jgi:small multidrug resistance pump
MAISYASLAAAILLGVAGQIALKQGVGGAATLLGQFLNPLTIIGLAIYFAAAILYIAALKRIPVSVAYPSISASYIIVAVLAHLLWNEPFGWPQLAGILLIGGGVVLINQH